MDSPLETTSYIDVGYGCPIELSSPARDASQVMVPSLQPGTYTFSTDLEPNPWMIIDLKALRAVRRIRVYNNEPHADRALPLTVSASSDRETWSVLTIVRFSFGGQLSDSPLDMKFRAPLTMRYLRFQAAGKTKLHFDYVEVSVTTPILRYGRFVDVQVGPDALTARWAHHRSFGFSWTFTAAFKAILLANASRIRIERVDFSAALAAFKDEPGQDVYPELFEPDPSLIPSLQGAPDFTHHGIYATLKFDAYAPYIAAYFAVSRKVRDRARSWMQAYELQPDNTIVIVYRGTDKDTEVKLAPIESYIRVAKHLLHQTPGLRVCVQTDQEEALEAVLAAIPGAVYLRELPVTTGRIVIHKLAVEERFGIARLDLAIGLLAMTNLYSNFRYIVSHTGNIGLWLAFYRGHSEGLYQFDAEAQLRDPSGAVLAVDGLRT